MTDSIDLDELGGGEERADRPNRGDWFWKGEGDPADENETAETDTTAAEATADPADRVASTESTAGRTAEADSQRVPHVPRANEGRPAGIPVEQGGSGGGAGRADETAGDASTADHQRAETTEVAEDAPAAGPHGGGADDMTLAMSYAAAKRLADPAAVFADVSAWADWVGIVGDVEAHVINKFQRDNLLDLDFFNGTGTGPGERLAEIDRHSMFFAERMVLVGVDGEETLAEMADWEFVPLGEAAEAADWDLHDE